MSDDELSPTADKAYAERLMRLQGARWKKVLNVQGPWKWNFRRMRLGRTLDVGCGIGRNLGSLDPASVGVDHNVHAVDIARQSGVSAYTVDEFFASPELTRPGGFDSMLLAHVIEHLTPDESRSIIASYLPLIKPGGRVVFVCPQERGYASDSTHITFVDFDALGDLARDLGLEPIERYSFPFPRWMGRLFIYNEFYVISRTPSS